MDTKKFFEEAQRFIEIHKRSSGPAQSRAPRSKTGVIIPEGQFQACQYAKLREGGTRARLIDLARQFHERVQALKEAASATAHAGLTRRRILTAEGTDAAPGTRSVAQARLVDDIPMKSFKSDLRRKRALRGVMPQHDESETHPGGDPALQGQLNKEDPEVNYRYSGDSERRCETCKFFDGASGCEKVAGAIRKVDLCDLYEAGRAAEAVRVFRNGMKKYPR